MNVTMRQIEERLADVDWKAAAEGNAIDKLTQPIFEGAKAEAEYDARSRIAQTWSVAGFLVSGLLAVSETKTWGSTAACYVLIAGCIITFYRSHRARKTLQRAREATYAVADEISAEFPREPADEPAPEA